jgi:excisionase family DNA binding protein
MHSEFYSVKEIASIFSVHESTIRRAILKGFIPFIRTGKGKKSPYRISKKFVEEIHKSSLANFKLHLISLEEK